uniref:BTB domain-containing protein n=1 Tax=Strongyloides papillosus TaxID=174720 RepID=A0A0N5B6S2_STREA
MLTSKTGTLNSLTDDMEHLHLERHFFPGVKITLKDSDLILTEDCGTISENSILFDTIDCLFTIKYQKCDNGNDGMVIMSASKMENYEIVNKILIKVRSFNNDGSIYKDHACICHVGTRCEPFLMEFCKTLLHSRNIDLNIEIIYKNIEVLPDLKYGDLKLQFNDGSSLLLYKSFISQHSIVLRETLKEKMNEEEIFVLMIDNCSCEDFKEMLYYLYLPSRIIGHSFIKIAEIAVKFKVPYLLHKCSLHLSRLEGYKWTEKIDKALQLHLYEAVDILSMTAFRTGIWDTMIFNGFDPINHFGEEVYERLIKPSIEKAQKNDWMLF